ncbi:MAG: threonine synthase [Phascolarctobacterium sp.]|nr:threonine synthase [Candidatus Phascolarctobacterium caballi]
MLYTSTRGIKGLVTSACVIQKGLAPDGGLYVPVHIPTLSRDEILEMCDLPYSTRALRILSYFLTDFNDSELYSALVNAYNQKKFKDETTPLSIINNRLGILELWHGPTCAFKDLALQLLPQLMTLSAKKLGDERKTVILVATSGDTGKAALEGFKDVAGTEIIVFYPNDGVSDIQKLQMQTAEGNNVKVFGIDGNFDDAQRGVKEIFGDAEFAKELNDKGFVLSSANSINWGRLVPQIVYYFSAYCDLVKKGTIKIGEKINFVVPTGNFGNILAGYYALKMGLPINKLICASNSNNVLTDFLKNGKYDKKREFYHTMSPSMDILVSSNLERLLYYMTDSNAEKVNGYMEDLNADSEYKINEKEVAELKKIFYGAWADDEKTKERIQLMYMVNNYIIDPHTAVALSALNDYRANNQNDNHFTVVLSTASAFKFSKDVLKALDKNYSGDDSSVAAMQKLADKIGGKTPNRLKNVTEKPVLHSEVIKFDDMRQKIKDFLFTEQ